MGLKSLAPQLPVIFMETIIKKAPIPILFTVIILGFGRMFETISDLFLLNQVKIYWYIIILLLNSGMLISLYMTYKLKKWAPFIYIGAYTAVPFVYQLAGASIFHAWILVFNPIIFLCCVLPYWKKLP